MAGMSAGASRLAEQEEARREARAALRRAQVARAAAERDAEADALAGLAAAERAAERAAAEQARRASRVVCRTARDGVRFRSLPEHYAQAAGWAPSAAVVSAAQAEEEARRTEYRPAQRGAIARDAAPAYRRATAVHGNARRP